MTPPAPPTAARRATEALIGWPLAAALGLLAVPVGATVMGMGAALEMLSLMPVVARLGRSVGPPARELAWPWRC